MSLSKIKVRDLESIAPDSVIGSDGSGNPSIIAKTDLGGVEGKSAYQVAVDEGFAGTEAEWLTSLQGEQGVPGVDSPSTATGNEITNVLLDGKPDLVLTNNHFDVTKITPGKRLTSDGNIVDNATRNISTYIRVNPNEDWRVENQSGGVVESVVFYDKSGNYISGEQGNIRPFTTPPNPNTYYLRIGYFSEDINLKLARQSDFANVSFDYTTTLDSSELDVNLSEVIFDRKITKDDTDIFEELYEETDNIFNKNGNDIVVDQILNTTDGTISSNTTYSTVIEFPIPSYVENISFAVNTRHIFLDENKNIISGSGANTIGSEIPENAKFVSYSFVKANQDTFMVSFSENRENFVEWKEPKITVPNLGTTPSNQLPLDIALPELVTHVIGDDTKKLYNYGTAAINSYDIYDFKWTTNYPNNEVFNQHKGLVIRATQTGIYDASLTVRNDLNKIVGFAETQIKVVSDINRAKDKNVLIVSDSWWDNEDAALDLINSSTTPFQTTGTKTSPNGNLHEARGGARSETYLAQGDGSGFVTPFLNTAGDGIDFTKYITDNSITVDYVLIQFGLNSFSQIDEEIVEIEELITELNATGMSSRQVILANPPFKGINGGVEDKLSDRIKIIKLKKAYKDIASRILNVTHLDLAINFDSETNFLSDTATPINSYHPATEFKAAQIIHPLSQTYAQQARALLSRLVELETP